MLNKTNLLRYMTSGRKNRILKIRNAKMMLVRTCMVYSFLDKKSKKKNIAM